MVMNMLQSMTPRTSLRNNIFRIKTVKRFKSFTRDTNNETITSHLERNKHNIILRKLNHTYKQILQSATTSYYNT